LSILKVGDWVRLSESQYAYATKIGNDRNVVGASQNRQAKRNDAFKHIKGARGEVALAVMLGLPVHLVKCLGHASREPDFVCTVPSLEVKNGWPISGKHNHSREALHVVLRQMDHLGYVLQITHMAYGWQCNEEPARLPIPGTEKDNWNIPNAIQEIEIEIKLDIDLGDVEECA
jgi:hypothetical protein